MTVPTERLLGRIPSTIDPRDYPLDAFLSGGDDLDAALAALLKSWEGRATKKWAEIITARVKSLVPAPTPPAPQPVVTTWLDDDDPVLDQGDTGHCVGFGGTDWLNALPVDDHQPNQYGHDLYYLCKIEDGEPNAENGSTVRSLAKVLQNQGHLKTYAWASTVGEVQAFVASQGPVIFGTDWTQAMFNPDENGIITPTGPVAGGHCYLCVGYDPVSNLFEFLNSWGASWAKNGRFFMHADDVKILLAGIDSRGEACAGVEVAAA